MSFPGIRFRAMESLTAVTEKDWVSIYHLPTSILQLS